MLTVLLILATTAPAAPTYRCGFAAVALQIDGKLDDTAWNDAEWTGEFVDVASGEKAELKTRVRILWDERNLYVGAELAEPNVAATMTEHDALLWQENAFELFLDPDADGKDYVELEFNARETVMDLIMSKPYRQRGRADLPWTAEGLKSAVHVDGTLNDPADRDRGWSVEMAIPWTALAKLTPAPKPGERWRVEMARVQGSGKQQKHWAWAATGERNYHVPDKWGWVEFTR